MIDSMMEEQKMLESEMRQATVLRFRKKHTDARERGDWGSSPIGVSIGRDLMTPFRDAIVDWMMEANSGKAGRNNLSANLIQEIDADTAAFLFTKTVLNLVPLPKKGKACTLTALAITGAGKIHDELRLRYFEENWRALARTMFKDFDKRDLPRAKRKEYVQKKFRDLHMDWSVWAKADMVHLGTKLTELFRDSTGAIRLYRTSRPRSRIEIAPTPELLEAIEKRMTANEALFTSFFPMVIPPRPWNGDQLYAGGYYTQNVTPYPLVKHASKEYLRELESIDIDTTLVAINALQETPWRVNERVLEALEYAYHLDQSLGDFPPSNPQDIPPKPPEADTDEAASKAYRKACYLVHEDNRRNLSKRIAVLQTFALAHRFKKYPKIYFPHDLDSRGRAYPKAPMLNPQGADYSKAILEFANGKPLGTEDAACWLAIHGANSWGEDKVSLQERIDWVLNNEELIKSIATDPTGDIRWTEADAPGAFLAFCFAWQGYLEQGLDYECHLPIAVDATCSGLQHYSAMLKDEVGGYSVNLIPNDTRQDIYQLVADRAMQLIEEDLAGENDEVARAWVEFGMTRKITKRSVMVVPYAATFHACMQYTADGVEERLAKGEPNFYGGNLSDFTVYGAKKIWKAIEETVIAATGAMRWISDAARQYSRVSDVPYIEWVVPTGFLVWQNKPQLKAHRVDTFLDGKRLQVRYQEAKKNLDPRTMASSTPPSFVHSLDAAHMTMTIEYAINNGVHDFAAVHDSFGTHACNMPMFNLCIREAFVDMYQVDVLKMLKDHMERNTPEPLPDLPEQGSLVLEGVLDSEFFFS